MQTTRPSHILVRSIAALLVISSPAIAEVWDGSDSLDWNNPANWDTNLVPNNVNAFINVNGPNIATILANISATPVDIIVGDGAGANGLLNHTAGTAQTGMNNWMLVGIHGGTGTYNLADTTTTGGTLTGFGLGSGEMVVGNATTSGRLYVGGANNGTTGGNGTVNVNTSGTLTIRNDLKLGSNGGTGVMNVDSGAITTGGWNFIGSNEGAGGGNGSLNMSGGTLTNTGRTYVGQSGVTGKLTLSGGDYTDVNNAIFIIGEGANSNGTVEVNNANSQLSVGGEMWVGQDTGGNGKLNLSAGTVTVNNWLAVGRQNSTGVINLSGTAVLEKGATNHMIVGSDGANSNGSIVQTGGTLRTLGGEVRLGAAAGSPGSWQMTAGIGTLAGTLVVGDGGPGTMAVSGSANLTAPLIAIGRASPGILTQTGGSITAPSFDVMASATFLGTYTLTGGLLTTNSISLENGVFTFTGGTITRSGAGVLTLDGPFSPDAIPATLKLDADKTFDVNGAFDITIGLTLDLTGLTIPAYDGVGIDTGTFQLGVVDSIIDTFDPTSNPLVGLLNLAGATYISETAGETTAFDPSTNSVYWVQESAGAVTLQYSVVPEPAALSLLGVSALALLGRRRRK